MTYIYWWKYRYSNHIFVQSNSAGVALILYQVRANWVQMGAKFRAWMIEIFATVIYCGEYLNHSCSTILHPFNHFAPFKYFPCASLSPQAVIASTQRLIWWWMDVANHLKHISMYYHHFNVIDFDGLIWHAWIRMKTHVYQMNLITSGGYDWI